MAKETQVSMSADTEPKEPVSADNNINATGEPEASNTGTPEGKKEGDNINKGEGSKGDGQGEPQAKSFDDRYQDALAKKQKEHNEKNGIEDPKGEGDDQPKAKSNEELEAELSELRQKLDDSNKEKETEKKRRSDTQKKFHELNKELKELKGQNSTDPQNKTGEDAGAENGESASDEKSDELTLEALGLSEETLEEIKDDPVMKEFYEKSLKVMNSKLETVTQAQDEQREKIIAEKEQELAEQEEILEKNWVQEASKEVEGLEDTLEDPRFQAWLKDNPTLIRTLRTDSEGKVKDRFDPSWLVDTVNSYNSYTQGFVKAKEERKKTVEDSLPPASTPPAGQPTTEPKKKSWNERYQEAVAKKKAKLGM